MVRLANRYLIPLYMCLKLGPVFHHQAEKQPSRPKEYIRYTEGFPPAPTVTHCLNWGKGCPTQDARHSANSASLLTWLLLSYKNVQATSIHKHLLQLFYIYVYLNYQPTSSFLHTSRLNNCKHFTGRDKNIQGKLRLTVTLMARPDESNSIFFI